jgi:hypothetical protein
MKNANKRLILSLAALVISIALAATSTFAWFTMDATPEVSNINLTVTAQSGLEISYLYETSPGVYSQSAYKSYIDFTEDANGLSDGNTTFAEYLQNLVTLKAVSPSDEGAYPIIGYVYEKDGAVAGSATVPGTYTFAYDYLTPLYEKELVDVMKTENNAPYELDSDGRKIVIRAYVDGAGSFEYVYKKVGVGPGTRLSAGAYVVTSEVESAQAVESNAFVYDGTTPVYIQATTNTEDYALDFGGQKKCIRAYYYDNVAEEYKYVYVYEKTGVSAGDATTAGEYTFNDPVVYESEPKAAVNVQATENGTPVYNGTDPVYIHQTTNNGALTSTPGTCIVAYGQTKEYTASSTTNFLTVDAGSNKAIAAENYTYAALRFRFRSLSNYQIRLTQASVTSSAYHGNYLDWDGVDGGGVVLDTNAANAARVGFAQSTYAPETDIYTKGTTISTIYEPNYNKGYTAAGINGANSYYQYITGHTNPIPTTGYTTIKDSDLAANLGNNTVLDSLTLATTGANAGYYVGEITIYIWIEGTDYDCFNIVLGDNMAINLFFTGNSIE